MQYYAEYPLTKQNSALIFKAESAGKAIVAVNPKNTSKMCSNPDCLHVKEDLTLADRTYHCQACGLTMPRDVNSAKTIKRIGMILAIDQKIDFRSPSQIPIWEG